MKSFLFALLLLPYLTGAVLAQSVDSLVSEALARFPRLAAIDHQIRAADHQAAAAGALPAPSLSVEFSQVPVARPNLLNGAVSNNLSFSQMFMLGGKLSAMADVERKRGLVLSQNRASLAVYVRGQVKMAYYRLWLLDRRIDVQESTIRILEELGGSMRTQVLTNRIRQADLLTIQAEVAAERARLTSMHSERVSLQNALFVLLGRDSVGLEVLPDHQLPDSHVQFDVGRLEERAALAHPNLKAMDRMKEMNTSEITVARRDLVPDLMLQGMLMRMPDGMLLTAGPKSVTAVQQSAAGMPMQGTDWMFSVMASLTLPFMPWSVERSTQRVEAYEALGEGIDAERASMQRDMLATLRSSIVRYQTADSLAHTYELSILPLMRDAAEAQTSAYQTGLVPLANVLDARRMELMRKDDHLMAVADRHMALAEVEMMLGEPLESFLSN